MRTLMEEESHTKPCCTGQGEGIYSKKEGKILILIRCNRTAPAHHTSELPLVFLRAHVTHPARRMSLPWCCVSLRAHEGRGVLAGARGFGEGDTW